MHFLDARLIIFNFVTPYKDLNVTIFKYFGHRANNLMIKIDIEGSRPRSKSLACPISKKKHVML